MIEPLFHLGPISIHFFGVMIAVGALIGVGLLVHEAKKANVEKDLLLDGVFYSLLGGILGARVIFVFVYNPGYYLERPLEILFINQGGLSIHGGIIGGLLTGYIYLKKKKLSVWNTLDLVAPSLILAQGISRIGCDVFGFAAPDWWPIKIENNGEMVHPAQAYEFTLNYILFGYLWLKLQAPRYTGEVFLHYLFGFMLIRGIVEFSRVNPQVIGGLSVSHVMSLIGMAIAVYFIVKKKGQHKGEFPVPISSNREKWKVAVTVAILLILSLLLYFNVQG
ncbi:prolipoprotein diacylglyceryl transferase [Salipaludibacillus daqingensis]|uniref:prolipoprotein diacylglyceryl transferase n=1 Tax=Salipaludibacillus daqingensis TaxID=3041001 RepID=UPI002474C299|nr:prolipoprotein diacylglyceryl transferase [Salipaludibacillus daqingensis]